MNKTWLVLGLAFLAQNVAVGIPFGSFGLLIGDIAADFSSGRSQVSLAIALIMLTMGLLSPLLGYLLDRWSIRGTMMAGALIAAVGFQLAARADSLLLFLLGFGVVVGAGIAALGVLPACKLAANWCPLTAGRAIGFVSLPLLIALAPPLFGMIIADFGWRELLKGFSYVYLLILPLLALIQDRPPEASVDAPPTTLPLTDSDGWRAVLDRRLLFMVPMGGIILAGGIVLVTHVVQHAVGLGIDLPSASLLISVNGIAAVGGAMLFGWLSDRLSPLKALGINVTAQAIIWPLLLLQTQLAGLAVCVAVAGLCAGGGHPALSALINQIYGAVRFGTMLGLVMMLVIPFTFTAAPLVGLLFDINGNYTAAFILLAVLYMALLIVLASAGSRLLGLRRVTPAI